MESVETELGFLGSFAYDEVRALIVRFKSGGKTRSAKELPRLMSRTSSTEIGSRQPLSESRLGAVTNGLTPSPFF
jgi:hypothetical protein